MYVWVPSWCGVRDGSKLYAKLGDARVACCLVGGLVGGMGQNRLRMPKSRFETG